MPKESRFGRLNTGAAPLLELTGNRRLTVEGSTGILLYEAGQIKLSTGRMIVSVSGRGLRLRCISGSCVEISGFISNIEFLC